MKNFEKFQHYSDRRPPWIKLYRDLWRDPRFFVLNERERYFLISFFILASQNDNKVPANQGWLQHEMATGQTIPVKRLIETEWLYEWESDAIETKHLKHASSLVSKNDDVDKETETEKQRREEKENAPVKFAYGESGNVMLTLDEYEKLGQRLGVLRQEYIDQLDRYAGVNPKRFKQYTEHYKVILTWHANELRKAGRSVVSEPVEKVEHGLHQCNFCEKPHMWNCGGCDYEGPLACPQSPIHGKAKAAHE